MFMSEDEEMMVEDLPNEGFNKASDNCRTYATQSITPIAFPLLSQHISLQKLSGSSVSSADNSLGESIVIANAELLKKGLISYCKECVGQSSNGVLVSRDCTGQGLGISGGYEEEDSVLESLVGKNKLLDRATKELLTSTCQEFSELGEFFKQIREIIGVTTAHELVYLIAAVLRVKVEGFREMTKEGMSELIPKMERFWGEDLEEEFGGSGWEVYQDADQAKVKRFAVGGVEQLAAKLYFAPELKFLSLRELGLPAEKVMDKFSSFACFVSQLSFMSMSGMVLADSQLDEFCQELKLDVGEDGEMGRAVMKKVKLQ